MKGRLSDFWFVQDLELHVELFKKSEILPVSCQYIFSLINFILNNKENFQTNSSLHSINTTNKHHFHRQNVNLLCFERSTFYDGIRIFTSLPRCLTSPKQEKTQFKVAWGIYLNAHSFYSIYEFLSAFAKLRKTIVSFVMSVRLSVLPHGTFDSHWTYLSENLCRRIFWKIYQENSSFINLTIITVTLHEELLTFTIITTKMFKQIHLYAVLVQEISTIFIDQPPTVQVSEQCLLCWHQILKNYHLLSQILGI